MRHEIEKLRDELREIASGNSENGFVKAALIREQTLILLLIDKLDAILATSTDDYKRGVVDGMTTSANFVADDFMQGRDNDRMRLADSLRDEAKRVSEEK